MTSWTQVRLVTAPQNADVCAQLLIEAGCDGVQIDDCAVIQDGSEDATVLPKATATVTGYLITQSAQGRTTVEVKNHFETAIAQGRIAAEVAVEPLLDEDWSQSWREHFPPLHIGPFLIVPSWEEVTTDEVAPGTILIRLDPGLAFGTGQHPTTGMCLELLAEHLASALQDKTDDTLRLLDVGCGSGILSIGAAKLGARVTASDFDLFCVQATRDNAEANDVPVNVVQVLGLDWVGESFDVVVANLTSMVLISLADDLGDVTRDGGTLIASGISAPRAAEVEAALQAAGFATIAKREQDGEQRGDFVERWVAFVMQKAAA